MDGKECPRNDCTHRTSVTGECMLEECVLKEPEIVEITEEDCFDVVEIYEDCTVEVWTNSKTGATSVGWYENERPPKKVL